MCRYMPVSKSRAQLVEMVCIHLFVCMYVYMRASHTYERTEAPNYLSRVMNLLRREIGT